MIKPLKFSIVTFVLLMLATWTTDVQAQGIEFFHGTFAEAQQKAEKEGKLIFMDAYTTWCGPCRMMAKNAFPNPEVGAYFNKHFVNLKMDMEKGEGRTLGRKYRVVAYPSLFFLKPDGSVAHRAVGMKNANQLIALGKQAEAKK